MSDLGKNDKVCGSGAATPLARDPGPSGVSQSDVTPAKLTELFSSVKAKFDEASRKIDAICSDPTSKALPQQSTLTDVALLLQALQFRIYIWSTDIIDDDRDTSVSVLDVLSAIEEFDCAAVGTIAQCLEDILKNIQSVLKSLTSESHYKESREYVNSLKTSIAHLEELKPTIQGEILRILDPYKVHPNTGSVAPTILCMDAGGVRSLSSLLVLHAVMDEINKQLEKQGQKILEPYEAFDYMFGASSGGLIVMMLGRLKHPIIQSKSLFEKYCGRIFGHPRALYYLSLGLIGPRYSNERLIEAIQLVVDEFDLSAPDNQWRRNLFATPDVSCKVGVLACQELSGGSLSMRPYLFRTYSTSTPIDSTKEWQYRVIEDSLSDNVHVWQVAQATTAALRYFPPTRIGDSVFWDPALIMKNPTLQAFHEVASINQQKLQQSLVVSIGCGSAPPPTEAPRFLPQIFRVVRDIILSSSSYEKVHHEMSHLAELSRVKYFRFGGPRLDLYFDEWRSEKEEGYRAKWFAVARRFSKRRQHKDNPLATSRYIESQTKEYLSQDDVRDEIVKCAEIIVRNWRLRKEAQRRQRILECLREIRTGEPPLSAPLPSLDSRLYVAVGQKREEDVRILLENKADPNWRNEKEDGKTALFCSVITTDIVIIKLLLEAGADPEVKSDNGQTPLSYARAQGLEDIVEVLTVATRGSEINPSPG